MLNSSAAEDIKQIPPDDKVRQRIREEAAQKAVRLRAVPEEDLQAPPEREQLQQWAEELRQEHNWPRAWLGFIMVALDNALWQREYAAVPYQRRLLLLPKCLNAADKCAGWLDAEGLHCAGCGQCDLHRLKSEAEALGYRVIIAEGTSAVVSLVLEGSADAILGVACLDSLDKSFERIVDAGIPHQAVPLLRDGCQNTEAELEYIRELLHLNSSSWPTLKTSESVRIPKAPSFRTYLPLLRYTQRLFSQDLEELLSDCRCVLHFPADTRAALEATDFIARDWLLQGGKRLRPFITVAAYAVRRAGLFVLASDTNLDQIIAPPIRALAIAIEALHKASLVHDDIEDADVYRYGQPTIHRRYGLEAAINVGDYLVGLGYRLIAAQKESLGAECVSDILAKLSAAHLQLCCGQGAELLWHRYPAEKFEPLQALQIASLKTAPAFEAALYTGLRAAGPINHEKWLRQFALYVGEGYQVLDDLTDWEAEDTALESLSCVRDLAAGRPTILYAFAMQAGGAEKLAVLREKCQDEPHKALAQARQLFDELGVFVKAQQLYERLRQKALQIADEVPEAELGPLLRFLVRNILSRRFVLSA